MQRSYVMEQTNEIIRDVAIYLRKSRGIDEDLDKHRLALIDLCKKLGCNYTEYAEIGTSDSIENRPIFSKLIKDINQELFDAICVMDLDRLGRGDNEDWGKIEKTIKKNEILIITPDKIYDWSNNDNDEFQIEVKNFFARLEYKTISKRLRRGKILGAKKGKWTNGKPPYPYIYNKDKQALEVDEEKLVVYKQILTWTLGGETPEHIMAKLNTMGIKSPGGKYWSGTAVYRLMTDLTHLGKIVYGKQKGSGHKNRKTKPLIHFDKVDWQIVDGDHHPLKTQAEHNQIMELYANRKIKATRAREGAFTLSGLVVCGKCGYAMQFTHNGKNKKEYIKKCQKSDPFGCRCGNQGINIDLIIDKIIGDLLSYKEEIETKMVNTKETETELLKVTISQNEKDLKKEENAIGILQEQRENGEISKEKFLERRNVRLQNIEKLQKEICELQERVTKREEITNGQRIKSIEDFFTRWENATDSNEKNKLLRRIVERIEYSRDGDNVHIKVNFI